MKPNAKFTHSGESATSPASPQTEKAGPQAPGFNTTSNWRIALKETKDVGDLHMPNSVDHNQVPKLGMLSKERKPKAVLRETKSFKLSSFSPQHENPNRPPPLQSEKLKLPLIGGRNPESSGDTHSQALRRMNAKYLNLAQSLARTTEPNLVATRQLLLDVLKELPASAPEAAPLFRLMIELVQTLGQNRDRGRGKAPDGMGQAQSGAMKQTLKKQMCDFFDAPEPSKKLLLANTKKRLSTSVEETPNNLPQPPVFDVLPGDDSAKAREIQSHSELPKSPGGVVSPSRKPKPFIPRLDMETVHRRAGSYF